MFKRIAASLLLMAALCAPVQGQGGCTPYHIYELSGGSSVDPNVQASPSWLAQVAQLESQYGIDPVERLIRAQKAMMIFGWMLTEALQQLNSKKVTSETRKQTQRVRNQRTGDSSAPAA